MYTHIIWCLLIFIFMRLYELYCYLSVDDCVIFKFHGIYYCFIPYLKDFVPVFKFFIKLVAYFFILVEFSNMLNLFSNLFLKTPTHNGRLDGRPCLVCIIKNLFKHVHEMGGREYELYTWFSLCFQLVSQLIFILYTHICLYICIL